MSMASVELETYIKKGAQIRESVNGEKLTSKNHYY
jgi:hypothetical protein